MKTKFLKPVLLIIGAFAISVGALEMSGFAQGQIIDIIQIKGNRRIEAEIIKANLSSKVGKAYSSETVKEDIKNIYKLGFFDDVAAELEKTEDGDALVFNVKEKPVLVDLRIRGNDAIETEDILAVMTVTEGQIIQLERVQSSLAAINKLYSEKGIVPTEVEFGIEPKGEGTVSLTYDIKEGKRAYIKKLDLFGNKSIDKDEILKSIYSKPKSFLSVLTQRGLYRREEIERDKERVRGVYLDNGYLDANVSGPEVEYSKDEEGYIVAFRIEEGPQYKVGVISFQGDLETSEQELADVLLLKPGEIFGASKLSRDIAKLTTFYGDRGYAFANIDPLFKQNKQDLLVDVILTVEKGALVSIGNIDIAGNTRTRDKVIRREISIQEQDKFSASKVQQIKSSVFRLGYFEDNVEVGTKLIPETEDRLDVNVRVKEKPTGFFSIAGGFSSVETFLFAGQIQESNLFGYGKSLGLSAQLGGVTRLFLLDYQDPNFLDSDYQLDLLLFRTAREFRDFDRDSLGATVGFGRNLFRNLSGRFAYRFENVNVSDVSEDASLLISDTDRKISSFTVGFGWDSRNNRIDPTKGNLTRTSVEYAGPFGGNTDFIKYSLSSRVFIPSFFKTVLSIGGQYGIINFRNNKDDLIVTERFFLGGPSDLRGFEFRRVGPRVPTDDGDFVIIGGTQEMFASLDYVIPILPEAGLKGVVFFDIGNVFNDNESLSLDIGDYRKDVGFGVRWISPLGPLRIEVGFPIGKRLSDEDTYEIQFTVGNLF
ncbi:MAG: outer membrane protein assembly factor BamA [Deltaproteobacteria bacterium]